MDKNYKKLQYAAQKEFIRMIIECLKHRKSFMKSFSNQIDCGQSKKKIRRFFAGTQAEELIN